MKDLLIFYSNCSSQANKTHVFWPYKKVKVPLLKSYYNKLRYSENKNNFKMHL